MSSHGLSTPITNIETHRPYSATTKEPPTKRLTLPRSTSVKDTTFPTSRDGISTATISTVAIFPHSSSNLRSDSSVKGLSNGVIISSSIAAFLGVIAIVVIVIILVRIWRKREIRRTKTRTVRSNTQLSFGNLSYVGEGGRRASCDEVDMTDFEVMRSRMVSTIKRKVSAFSLNSSKEHNNEQDSHNISCGRLSIVEEKYDNFVELGEIVQTYQV